MQFLQSATSISTENVAVEIHFFPAPHPPLEEMASSHEQNACRLRILPVKCLKTPPAGIGHWNVLGNRTHYRNAGSLQKNHLPLTVGGCAQKTAKWCLPGVWGSLNSTVHRHVASVLCRKVQFWLCLSFEHPLMHLQSSEDKNN